MKPKQPTCNTCNHQPYCLETLKQHTKPIQKCGYKNKPLQQNKLKNYNKKLLNKLKPPTKPTLCYKQIIPTGMNLPQTTCQLCAHHLFNCKGKQQT